MRLRLLVLPLFGSAVNIDCKGVSHGWLAHWLHKCEVVAMAKSEFESLQAGGIGFAKVKE